MLPLTLAWRSVAWRSVAWRGVVRRGVVWCDATWYVLPFGAVDVRGDTKARVSKCLSLAVLFAYHAMKLLLLLLVRKPPGHIFVLAILFDPMQQPRDREHKCSRD